MSSFLSEIGQTQCRRALVLAALPQVDDDQHQDGDDVGKHLGKVIGNGDSQHLGQVHICPVANAEHQGAPKQIDGLPQCKNNQRHRQPTEGLDGIDVRHCPSAALEFHGAEDARNTYQTGAYAGCEILIAGNGNARRICGSGVLTYRTQVQAGAGLLEEQPRSDGDDDGEIEQESVIEQYLGNDAQAVRQEGDLCGEHLKGRLATGVAAFGFDKEVGQEFGKSCAENGHDQANDVLVDPESNGEEAKHQAHEHGGSKSHRQRQKDQNQGIGICHVVGVEEHGDKAGGRTHAHSTGSAQIQGAGFLYDHFSQSRQRQKACKLKALL